MRFWGYQGGGAGQTPVLTDPVRIESALRDAYRRGRRDEQLRRRRFPRSQLTMILLAIAAIGAVGLCYAFEQGAFSVGSVGIDDRAAVAAAGQSLPDDTSRNPRQAAP